MKHCTVLDIGSSRISLMSAGTSSDGSLVVYGIETQPYSGYRIGELPAVAPLGEAIDACIARHRAATGQSFRQVCVGVPAPFIKTAVTSCEIEVASRSGRVTEDDLAYLMDEAAEFEHPKGFELMHSTPFDYSLDGRHCDSSPVGLTADRLSARFCHAFVDSRFSSMVVDLFDSLGISVSSFVSSEMTGASFTIPLDARMNGAVLIDCGGTHCDVSAVRGNAVLRTETIGIGGTHFTNDIALGLRLPFKIAEELKRRYVFGLDYGESTELVRIPTEGIVEIEHSTVQMIIEARADELSTMLCETLDSIEKELPDGSPVYMIGGGIAPMRGGVDYISSRTGRAVNVNLPRLSGLNGASQAPVIALAQFMLYGGAVQGGYQKVAMGTPGLGGRLFSNLRDFFTVSNKR